MKNITKVCLLAFALNGVAFAADSPTTATSSAEVSTFQKLKDGPVGLSFIQEFGSQNNGKGNYIGNDSTSIIYLGYKFNENNSIKLENRYLSKFVRPTPQKAKELSGHWGRHVLSYTRSNILKEDVHGVGLAAKIEARRYFAHEEKNTRNQKGIYRASLTATKSFGKIDTASTIYYAKADKISDYYLTKEDRKENGKDVKVDIQSNTRAAYFYAALNQAYNFTDKFSMSFTEEFFKGVRKGTLSTGLKKETELFEVTLDGTYKVTPDFSVYVSTKAAGLMKAHDKKVFAKDWTKNIAYGLGATYTAF